MNPDVSLFRQSIFRKLNSIIVTTELRMLNPYYIDYEDSSEPIMEIALYEDILTPDKEVILTPNYSLRLATKRVFKNETTFKVYLDVVKNTLIVCSENYDIDKE